MRTMAAGKFKAQCLAVMDEVEAKREPVIVTKHGKPVAKLVPIPMDEDPIFGFYKGKIQIHGDIVAPPYSEQELDTMFEESMRVFER